MKELKVRCQQQRVCIQECSFNVMGKDPKERCIAEFQSGTYHVTMNLECKNVVGEKVGSAILLIGPTGAGKTPLGEFLAECGLWGHRCLHFDFGANLRLVAEGGAGLPDSDVEIVRGVLSTGTLLENDQFAIAERIFRSFVERGRAGEGDLVVLNGLPRHVDQAADVDRLVDVVSVISLECSADVVYDRIRANSGGDRGERDDDAVHAIAAKLEVFRQRTVPLLAYYEEKGIVITKVAVGLHTSPSDIVSELQG